MVGLVDSVRSERFTFDRQVAPDQLSRLNRAYEDHDSAQFPYGYGGSVNVTDVCELFQHVTSTPTGDTFYVIDYGTRSGSRIGILLPMRKNKVHTAVAVLIKGSVPKQQLEEVVGQLAEHMLNPELAQDYWI